MKNKYLFHIFILNTAFLISSCQEQNRAHVECLKDNVFYEITNSIDCIEIEIKYESKDRGCHTVSKGSLFLNDGEYYDCRDKRLFLSVKRDTAYSIIDINKSPCKTNVYIGKTLNAPDSLPMTEFERRDDLFMSAFYSEDDGLFARYYFYDHNYNVLSVCSFILGEFK